VLLIARPHVAIWRKCDSDLGKERDSESGLGSRPYEWRRRELVRVLGCCGELFLDPGVCFYRLKVVRQADLA
jgi:hypothetical protein